MKAEIFICLFTLEVLFGGCWNPAGNLEPASGDAAAGTTTVLPEIDGYYIIGGDMLLDKANPAHRAIAGALVSGTRGIKINSIAKWPGGIVRYYYGDTFTLFERAKIRSAMHTIELVANIEFRQSSPDDYRYKIRRNQDPNVGGSSTLGYTENAVLMSEASIT
jgi:hypothetical protein